VITIARHREMTVKHTYDAPFATLLTPDPWTETKRRSEMFTHWPRNGSHNINGPGPLTRVIYIEKFIICRHLPLFLLPPPPLMQSIFEMQNDTRIGKGKGREPRYNGPLARKEMLPESRRRFIFNKANFYCR